MIKPFGLIKKFATPILLTCEHASSRIPRSFGRLGLRQEELIGAKDLFDPGSLALAKQMQIDLQCGLLYSNVSRLVIDANRRLDMKNVGQDLHHVPALKSEVLAEVGGIEKKVKIPANVRGNFQLEERKRYAEYVSPYFEAGMSYINELLKRHGQVFVVPIHSFYPVYNGDVRNVDIDILFDSSVMVGDFIFKELRQQKQVRVAKNIPWGLKDVDGGVFNAVQKLNNVHLTGFDINNASLRSKHAIDEMANILSLALRNASQLSKYVTSL